MQGSSEVCLSSSNNSSNSFSCIASSESSAYPYFKSTTNLKIKIHKNVLYLLYMDVKRGV
jgi:hypothetical protein